ncbi:hypothetical protein RRG08_039909 [Elysia crispata]|uniref:Uncharacterized protein n=1 Tax=Elysia crispata TaxID=231223 RepID=A0AAE1DNW1_9GAST|nr:hypothetical protein RRG08_039909 [Elysia crispata]
MNLFLLGGKIDSSDICTEESWIRCLCSLHVPKSYSQSTGPIFLHYDCHENARCRPNRCSLLRRQSQTRKLVTLVVS